MLFRPSLFMLLLGRLTSYLFPSMTGNWPRPTAVVSRQYLYKTDRMVGVTDNSALAIYTAYRYAKEVEVCMTIVWLYMCCYKNHFQKNVEGCRN